MTPRDFQVILDTDIGSDVDDAMALGVLLGAPGIHLVGATTVYGDTLLRARILLRYAALAGRDVPTFVGERAPLSGREVWWAGLEGTLHDGLDAERPERVRAVDFLTRTVPARPSEIDVLAIGPLTNLAAAITGDARFGPGVRHLTVMGGLFGKSRGPDGTGIEHNFRSDDVAARRVLDAAIPTTVVGLEITERVEFGPAHLARIADAGELGATLTADITQWWAYWNRTINTPHDPIAALTLTRPELFDFSDLGRVTVEVGGVSAGLSRFAPDADGKTRLVTDLDAPAVAEAIVAGIEAAGLATTTDGTRRAAESDAGLIPARIGGKALALRPDEDDDTAAN